jgi:hypothetical protein
MHFKSPTLVAMCLSVTALADNKDCYKSGVDWETLGSDVDIGNAFWRICDRIPQTLKIYETVSTHSQHTHTHIHTPLWVPRINGS